jgi:preprotein translocase subunit SecA
MLMARLQDEGVSWGYRGLEARMARIRAMREEAVCEDALRDGARQDESLRADSAHYAQERLLARACVWIRENLKLDVHDNQVAAALLMADGCMAQLPTGEGKTLAGAMAAILIASGGRGVLCLTINDYLARRDREWMGGLYSSFGLSSASVHAGSSREERMAAYRCRICHAAAREAGFDRLKDLMALDPAERLNPGMAAVLVDEADVILLDEARLPLVLAGPEEYDSIDLENVRRAVESLDPAQDLEFPDNGAKAILSPMGQEKLCRGLKLRGPHEDAEQAAWARINAAVHARFLLKRDRDYVLCAGDGRPEVGIVDEISGRIAPSRRWPWGVQAAVEVREGASRSREGEVLLSMTMERFILEFPFRCGMSASLEDSARELRDVYGTPTRVLPPNVPCVRRDLPDRIFDTVGHKLAAVTERAARAYASKQPVLIGTAGVDESETLGAMLRGRGLPCRILHAAKSEEEALIIALAGDPGQITVSTNMAGRGTDIRLAASFGPDSPEFGVATESGGLLVIGANRAESPRMDAQLRGRAGRQGEAGESQFFLSLDDPFFRKYGVREYLKPEMLACDGATGEYRHPGIMAEFQRAQRIIHGRNDESRRALRAYESVLDVQYAEFREYREEVLNDGGIPAAERRGALAVLDRAWADHVASSAALRQGLHLHVYGGRDPWREYVRLTGQEFDSLWMEISPEGSRDSPRERDSLFDRGPVRPQTLPRPDQRWTYAIEENLLPSWQLGKGPLSSASLANFLLLLLKPFSRKLRSRGP